LQGKILKKGYASFSEFVRDVAQIFHNAQVYNRPSAGIFEAAVRLRNIF
jgi:chromatin structure-remodeling complex subunit RSC1/2